MAELNTAQKTEAMARVAIGGNETGVARGRTKEFTKNLAKKHREKVEHEGAEVTLESWRAQQIDPEAAQKNIDANTSRKDSKGKMVKRSKKEQGVVDDIKASEVSVRDLIEKDFVDLTAGEKIRLVTGAKEALAKIPGGNVIIDSFSGDAAALDVFVENTLKSLAEEGGLREALVKQYKSVFGQTVEQNQALHEARDKISQVEAQQEANKTAIAANEAESKRLGGKLDEFEDRSAITGGVKGPRVDELNAANQKVIDFLASPAADKPGGAGKYTEPEIQGIRLSQEALSEKVARLQARNASLKGKVTTTMTQELSDAINQQSRERTLLAQFDGEAAERNQLEAERTQIKNDIKTLAQQHDNLETQKDRLRGDLAIAKTELAQAGADPIADYAKSVENIPQDALKALYEQRFRELAAVQESVLQEMIDHEVNPHAKKVLQEIQDGRWRQIVDAKNSKLKVPFIGNKVHGGRSLGHGEVERFDTKRIGEDIARIKTYGEKAPAMIVEDMLTEMGYGPTQRKELLASDEFKNRVIPKATERLLASALQADAISRKDSEAIQIAIGPEKMQQAMDSHKEWLEEQKKELGFVGPTVDFIKKHPKFGWWLALSIFYPPAGLLVGGGFALKGLFTKSNGHGGHEAEHAGAGAHVEKSKKEKKLEELVAPPVGMGGPGSLTPAGSHS